MFVQRVGDWPPPSERSPCYNVGTCLLGHRLHSSTAPLQHHLLYLFVPARITKLVHKVGEKYEILANILRPEVEDVQAVVNK